MQSCEELWQWIESFIGLIAPVEPAARVNEAERVDQAEYTNKAERIRERVELRAQQFRKLCVELGSPQEQFLSVHVAGSKGKGQTASYIAHGLAACGYRVGLYSSPHIHSYSERIQVLEQRQERSSQSEPYLAKQRYQRAGFHFESATTPAAEGLQHLPQAHIVSRDISEVLLREGNLLRERLNAYHWRKDWPLSSPEETQEQYFQPNFFSVLTLLAYFSFSALDCDWVVLETGIGGRLCPTNTLIPELSVITPIELEHTELLGKNLQQIAAEKAGIIKKTKPCVSSAQDVKVRTVLQNVCRERQSELHFSDEAVESLWPVWQKLVQEEGQAKGQTAEQSSSSSFAERLRKAFQTEQRLAFHLQDSEYSLQLRAASGTQQENLGLALLALQRLSQNHAIGMPKAAQGLECSRLLGRFAPFWQAEKRCLVLFDGAHTPSSCQRLLCDIEQYIRMANSGGEVDAKRKICLLFGAVKGKKFDEMAAVLLGNSAGEDFASKVPKKMPKKMTKRIFDEVLLTRAGTFKENDISTLRQAFERAAQLQIAQAQAQSQAQVQTQAKSHCNGLCQTQILPEIAEPQEALRHLLERDADLIVVCGSFYLLGELLPQRV